MTIDETIEDLKTLQNYFEEQSECSMVAIDSAIEYLKVLNEIQGEVLLKEALEECKHKLNITDEAFTLACEHIANDNKLLFSILGRTLIRTLRDYFISDAKKYLEVRRLAEDD